ncbi:hypothetical protein ERO13_D01G162740v2 [Gossypium hirsutum]|nr:hypothetical protein ERO13_D01G162740v2 [Gossypium hirsutum]
MHPLCPHSPRHPSLSRGFMACQALIRFFTLHRIKPHAPPLVRPPSIPLSFILVNVLPMQDQVKNYFLINQRSHRRLGLFFTKLTSLIN